MHKISLILFFTLGILVSSCKQVPEMEKNVEVDSYSETSEDNIRNSSLTNSSGQELYLVYNYTKNVAIIEDNGVQIELANQNPMDGVWYKNDHYDLRGVEYDLILRKDGNIIFENKLETQTELFFDEKNNTLQIDVNKTTGDALVYFTGLDSMTMKSQFPKTGMWYKNDKFELKGDDSKIELRKEGKLLFKHVKGNGKTLYKDDKGNKLELSFDQKIDEAHVSFNGGRIIKMKTQMPASGMWYKNGKYELRGKGESFDFSMH